MTDRDWTKAEEDCIANVLTGDFACAIEDYLDVPNRCFSVAVTVAEVLNELWIEASVRAVRAGAFPNDKNKWGRFWDTKNCRRPKHVILQVRERYFDVTSAQIAPGFPWVMEVFPDRQLRELKDWQFRYEDIGEYIPSKTMRKKCFSRDIAAMARGMFVAALTRDGHDVQSESCIRHDEYWTAEGYPPAYMQEFAE